MTLKFFPSNFSLEFSTDDCTSRCEQKPKEQDVKAFDFNLSKMKHQVEDLRREATLERMPLSFSIEEMLCYVNYHAKEDPLVYGFEKESDNPFVGTKCELL